MQTLINDVRDKLDAMGVFRYIDEDWGQLDEFAQNPPVKWPLALVDVVDALPSNVGKNAQYNQVVLVVRVADQRLSNSSQQAPEGQRTAAEYALTLAQSVFANLHGWHKSGSTYSTLQRVRLQRIKRGDLIREYEIQFSSLVTDTDAAIVTTDMKAQVPSVIKPSVAINI